MRLLDLSVSGKIKSYIFNFQDSIAFNATIYGSKNYNLTLDKSLLNSPQQPSASILFERPHLYLKCGIQVSANTPLLLADNIRYVDLNSALATGSPARDLPILGIHHFANDLNNLPIRFAAVSHSIGGFDLLNNNVYKCFDFFKIIESEFVFHIPTIQGRLSSATAGPAARGISMMIDFRFLEL